MTITSAYTVGDEHQTQRRQEEVLLDDVVSLRLRVSRLQCKQWRLQVSAAPSKKRDCLRIAATQLLLGNGSNTCCFKRLRYPAGCGTVVKQR